MIRHLKGTRYLRHNLQPNIQIQDKRIPPNIDTYTDANWASFATTRKSTTGFVTHFFGAAMHLWKHNTSNNKQSQTWYSSTGKPLHQQPRNRLEHAPTSGYTQTAAQLNRSQRKKVHQRKQAAFSCDTLNKHMCTVGL